MISRQRGRSGSGSESGFTLVELLVALALISVLATLAAFSLRQFWFVRALEGGKDGMVTTMRGIQQRVASASNPLVYGARFTVGSSVWELVEYHRESDPPICTDIQIGDLDPEQEFGVGVRISAVDFDDYVDERPSGDVDVTSTCLGAGTDIVWFFARGSATAGSVTVTQSTLGRSETICVAGLTGRVYEREGASC